MKIQRVRGTHDVYGEQLKSFNHIKNIISELAQIYNFKEIITPIFENTELFSKPLGENSDIVLKEMYSFLDRNNDSLTLRPEYTTPIIRAAISNDFLTKLPVKLFGFGPMFRRERPQKGRYRQFNQINFEILGTDDSLADVEIIILANNFLERIISKQKFKLFINSLGDNETVNEYKESLINYYSKYKNDLSEESKTKIARNPLRILDSKDKKDFKINSNSPKLENYYSSSARKKFDEIKSFLSKSNVDFEIDVNLVRGLDYYCHTVFEFKSDSLGSQDTLIGGGRYDGLTKILGGPDIPGVGWASGVERLMMLSKKIIEENSLVQVIILDSKFKEYGFNLINELRKNDINTYYDFKYNIKKSLKNANIDKIKFAIIIGEEEFKNQNFTLKDLSTGNQDKLNLIDIINKIGK